MTAADGSYNVPGLPPGTYEARATLAGFTPAARSGIQLAVGQQATLKFTLTVGAAETVVVTGLAVTRASARGALTTWPAT